MILWYSLAHSHALSTTWALPGTLRCSLNHLGTPCHKLMLSQPPWPTQVICNAIWYSVIRTHTGIHLITPNTPWNYMSHSGTPNFLDTPSLIITQAGTNWYTLQLHLSDLDTAHHSKILIPHSPQTDPLVHSVTLRNS